MRFRSAGAVISPYFFVMYWYSVVLIQRMAPKAPQILCAQLK